jgi:hypothetical protein
MIGVLLVREFLSPAKISEMFKSTKPCLPTGRLIVGRDAPAQANSRRDHYVLGGQSSNLDGQILGRCLKLISYGFKGSWIMVYGLAYRVQSSWFRVQELGFRVSSSRWYVYSLGFVLQGLWFRAG